MFNRFRILAAYLFAIPLALILGLLAASPDELTFMLIGMLLFFLALPLIVRWHHALLIVSWNSAFNAYFLPGQPYFWLLFAFLSFGLSVLSHVMGRKVFLPISEMTWPLVSLAVVVLGTAWYRGGIGFRFLGGMAHGGKFYVLIIGAILGYFALTTGQIPAARGGRMVALFFLSAATYVIGNLAYAFGQSFYFLFYLVPGSTAEGQVAADYGLTSIERIQGLAQTSIALVCFLLAWFGMRELFRAAKPWRFIILLLAAGLSLFAGFRSTSLILLLVLAFQFYLEGLHRTRLLTVLLSTTAAFLVLLFLYANRLPLPVQRAVSFLPINLDAAVRADAAGSWEWRYEMWTTVWKEVPKYLLVGKGYSFDPNEMAMTMQAIQLGILNSNEEPLLAGNYHSGPLSILVPFGIPGLLAFGWVLIAGFRVLHANFRHGEPRLRRLNTTLLAYYLAQCVTFVLIFGAFNTQLYIFLGVVGLSVSLNGGMKRAPAPFPLPRRRALRPAYAIELA